MKQFLQGLKIFVAIVVLFGGMQYIYAWSAPSSTAPGGNSVGPLNVSSVDQVKSGSLSLGGLVNSGNSLFTAGLKITSGSPGLGRVLVSDADGNARWSSISDILSASSTTTAGCPAGSELMTITGVDREFCGYSRTTGSTAYCDAFGSDYDRNLGCWDIGHGRNHGIQSFASGCTAWEGAENYGGQGALFYCEKQRYVPKTASDCTDSRAVVGTMTDISLSPNPITTCKIQEPTTYVCGRFSSSGYPYDLTGTLIGDNRCELYFRWVGYRYVFSSYPQPNFAPWQNYAATPIVPPFECPVGWEKYAGTCI